LAVWPLARVTETGVIAMPVNTGAVTFRVEMLEVMPFNEAVSDVVPSDRPVAMPLALTVATAMSEEAQVTEPEMLPEVPSE